MNKKNDTVTINGGGISFCSLLALLFIVLKLCGVITWSWLWVLAPLWIGVALVILFVVISYIMLMIWG